MLEGRLSFGRAQLPGRLSFAGWFGELTRVGGVNGRKPSFWGRFAFEVSLKLGEFIGRFAVLLMWFEFAGVSGRFPGVARASRGEIAGA